MLVSGVLVKLVPCALFGGDEGRSINYATCL